MEALYDAVLNGDAGAATSAAEAALSAAGGDAQKVLDTALMPAMTEVGRLFEEGEYFVPELLVSARAMKAALTTLRPALQQQQQQHASGTARASGTVVIATVQGDIHDIGKNLVAAMIEGQGIAVVDLGTDVGPSAFVAAVREHGARVVALSALLTTTMGAMRDVISALSAAGLRSQVRVLVGGAPLTADFAQQIGADAYAPDASSAARVAKQLLAETA